MSFENLGPIQLSPVEQSVEDFFTTVETCRPELLAEDGLAVGLLDKKEFAVSVRKQGIDVDFEDWDGLSDIEFLNLAKSIVSNRRHDEV